MTDSSLTEIEKKKQSNENNGSTVADPSGYAKTVLRQILTFGVMIVIGASMVYSGKVAQSNILPTDINCFPYTDTIPTITKADIDINIVKNKDGVFSTKLEFDETINNEIIKNGLLGSLKRSAEDKNSSTFSLYRNAIIQHAICNGLSVNNSYYNFLNSTFSESVVIFILSHFNMLWFVISCVVNTLYFIFFVWFQNLYLFNSKKTIVTYNDEKGNTREKASWKHDESIWKGGMFKAFFMLFIGFIALLTLFGFIPILTIFVSIYSIVMPMFMEAKVKNKNVPYTFSSALFDVFKYKLNIIMYVITYYLITNAHSYLGSVQSGIFLVLFIIMIFFTNFYKSYKPNAKDFATMGLGDFVQFVKECKTP